MKFLYLIIPFIIYQSCKTPELIHNSSATLISDVNIIDVRVGEVIKNQNIIIEAGKIIGIYDEITNSNHFHKHIIGHGAFVLPGLAEMHAHIPSANTSSERIEETLFLYLSNGITTIRGMLGDSSHLLLREKAYSSEIFSPRIYTSSPSLNGNSVTTITEADQKVRKYKNDGYDFLKIHPGIKLEVFNQVVKTAHEVGIPFSGHVPVEVGIRHAIKSGYASIDHVDGFIEGLVPADKNVNINENGFFGYNVAPLANPDLIGELVELTKKNKVWIVPTQSLFERWFAPISAKELLEQDEMKYMPSSTLRNWLRIKTQYMQDESFDVVQWNLFDSLRRVLIKSIQGQGHGILMGSDAPQLFNVPGFSIHHEIKGMQNAGMSKLEILQSGTINPAQFFGMEGTFGEIKAGFDADLIIVNGNPLQELESLRNLVGVMRAGRWISKSEIDEKLKEIAFNAEGK